MSCENPEIAKPYQHRAKRGNGVREPGGRIMLSYLSVYEKLPCCHRCRSSGLDLFVKLSRNKLRKKRCIQHGKAFLAVTKDRNH